MSPDSSAPSAVRESVCIEVIVSGALGCGARNRSRPHPRCRTVEAQVAQVFAFIRQSIEPGLPLAQFRFGSPNLPNEPPVAHPEEAYSSGAPKMCPVSYANTRSTLLTPQSPLPYCMTTRFSLA